MAGHEIAYYLLINIHEGCCIKVAKWGWRYSGSWDCLLPTNKYSWGRLHQSHKVRLEVTAGHEIACYPLINIHGGGCIRVTKWGWRSWRVMRLPLLSAVFKLSLWFFILPKLEPLLLFPLFQTKDICERVLCCYAWNLKNKWYPAVPMHVLFTCFHWHLWLLDHFVGCR